MAGIYRLERASLLFLSIGVDNVRADVQAVIESTFRNAVVKVDVSSNTPVVREGKNICNSQGTGFLISSSYVVTAGHVVRLDPECGAPIIILKSRKHNVNQLATVVGSGDDVALLKSNGPLATSMCALGLMNTDVYDAYGVRFGVPGEVLDPVPMAVRIGEKDSEFSPLVRLTGTPTESGESGGPVVYMFNVVGILKAKHKQYTGYSFMIVGSTLRSLMIQHNILMEGRVCNPVELYVSPPTSAILQTSLQPGSDLSEAARTTVLDEIKQASREVVASRPGVQVSERNGSVSISASDRQETRQVCHRVGSFRVCNSVPVVVSGKQMASKAVGDINDEVVKRLWQKFLVEVQEKR